MHNHFSSSYIIFASLETALKKYLYMSRVMRKETLHKYSIDIHEIISGNSDFVILDRYSFYRATVELHH